MLLEQVNGEVVASAEALVANVAFVARHTIPLLRRTITWISRNDGDGGLEEVLLPRYLVLLLLVELHGDEAAGGEAAVGYVAAVRWLAAVRFQVFVQIRQAFTPGGTKNNAESECRRSQRQMFPALPAAGRNLYSQ